MHNQEAGLKAEYFFIDKLKEKEIEYDYVDDWYDIEVKGNKVEVKSCRISIKMTRAKSSKRAILEGFVIGRFDFTKEENREKQFDENIWVCFIVRHEDQFIILGFKRAKELKKARYISIHQTRKMGLIPFENWTEMI